MKILWVSNAPFVGSGYGVQTELFCKRLAAAGHEVFVFGYWGHHGGVMNAGGVRILPQSLDGYGNDMIGAHVLNLKPDVTVLLADVWVFRPENVALMTAWAPVDHDPIPPLVAKPLLHAKHTWAMSRFAEREMRAIGLLPDYVPHGVDTKVYHPIDRDEARRRCGIEPGRFVAAMVATNKGYPSRKSLDRVLKAWGAFVQTHPDALLYIHTLPVIGDGIDLHQCAAFYDVPDKSLRFPDEYRFLRGDYDPARMNAIYNAADVLLAPSMGEGFGIPVVEAQAAGCPVMVTDFTAQAELCGAGTKIPVDDDDRFYTLQNSEQVIVKPSRIVTALEWAVERQGEKGLRTLAVDFAQQYDADKVFADYLLPALERQVEREKATEARRAARTAARLALRQPIPAEVIEVAEVQLEPAIPN